MRRKTICFITQTLNAKRERDILKAEIEKLKIKIDSLDKILHFYIQYAEDRLKAQSNFISEVADELWQLHEICMLLRASMAVAA